MPTTRSPAYEKARSDSAQLMAKPGNDEMLDLYGYGKIADGQDISGVAKPGMFDMVGKAKYNHWTKLLSENMNKADAEKRYIELVDMLKAKYGVRS
ncbi:acyl CoA binding protein [Amniculicola lignicola CBS 123094]|uniref:Acyl CoA binding protein n=1 Tax=Amniculicola lignicola CBS 123094 TaxID=1392246 RepID=A0A6A5WQ85_9PLEO|nr:acyl CoA binding protein [Amniculicola lignicola CBS 123094]